MEQSIEAFRHLYGIKPVKQLAEEARTTAITLHRWVETGQQHRTNPVEHIVALTRVTGDSALVDCVCRGSGGFFVPNPKLKNGVARDLMVTENELLTNYFETMRHISQASRDKVISPGQARLIRSGWERLKSFTEGFVQACERGTFQRQLIAWFFKLYPFWDAATPGGLIDLN